MNITPIEKLERHLAKQWGWRRKELTSFALSVFLSEELKSTTPTILENTLLKMFVVLLYSHWEGFLISAAQAYCEFLNDENIKYRDLADSFTVYCILDKFDGEFPKKFSACIDAVAIVTGELNENLNINTAKYISGKSNLNSNVLQDILSKLGLNYANYELQANLIDESFLGLRNAISHGEQRMLSKPEIKELYEKILLMMETYKGQIASAAQDKSYLRIPAIKHSNP